MSHQSKGGLGIAMIVLLIVPVCAQNLDWNITGAGARAEGFAGAFIGVADDATSIVWNPAGLATLERPEASIVTRLISESADYTDATSSSNNANESQSHFALNFGSFAMPLKAGGNNIVVAIAYQRQLDMFAKSKDSFEDFESSGGANTVTPGVGVRLSPMFSVGLAANIWLSQYDINSTDLSTQDKTTVTGKFSGTNFVLGGLIDFSSQQSKLPLKVGVSLKTPFDLKIDQTFTSTQLASSVSGTLTAQMPLMLGFGASYQPSDNLTLALDYEIRGYGSKEYSQNVNGTTTIGPMSDSKEGLNELRIGAEYLIVTSSSVIPIRVGYRTVPTVLANYDDSGNSTGQVSGGAFSIGSGFVTDKFAIDLTYNSSSYTQTLGTVGSIKYATGTLSTSVIFYF